MNENDIQNAIRVILEYGMLEEIHHKQWVLDQVLRFLLSSNYEERIKEFNSDVDYGPWDPGIPP
jgi:hypothetical protein